MKMKLATLASAMLVLSIFGVGVVSAHGHNGDPAGTQGSAASAAQHTVSYSARCTGAAQGGTIHVQAKVKHGDHGKSFSATASALFTSSTPLVNLRRDGKSLTATGKIPVPAGQGVGPVTVAVTITYNGVQTTLTCTSQVHAAAAASTTANNNTSANDTDNDNDGDHDNAGKNENDIETNNDND